MCERYSIDAEEGIVQIDQVTVANSRGRLDFFLDWMSPDLDDPRHICASDRERLGRLDQDPVEILGQVLLC